MEVCDGNILLRTYFVISSGRSLNEKNRYDFNFNLQNHGRFHQRHCNNNDDDNDDADDDDDVGGG